LIRVAVIGFGYWGPNLARNLSIAGRSRVAAVCDVEPAKLKLARECYPQAGTFESAAQTIESADVDAVVIATPARSHFDLALCALRANKHVLLSKPMVETSQQAIQLIEEAERRGLVLLVDHTFIYTSAVQRMRQLFRTGEIGDLCYYDSMRMNLGGFQPDVSVLWDLALHDLSILDYVFDARPLGVSVIGTSDAAGLPESLAFVTLFLPQRAIAHINVNWLAPVKLRQTRIVGSNKMIVYDEMETSEKLRIYERLAPIYSDDERLERRIGYRVGQMTAPPLATREALANEAEHFLECIEIGTAPITSGASALRLITLLECADRSMRQRGRVIETGSIDREETCIYKN
jgi:predicted dehydrogenase